MGVAGLFAFLRRKYPEIVDACAQQAEEVAEGESSCEHLYIDLNHIIHVSAGELALLCRCILVCGHAFVRMLVLCPAQQCGVHDV